MNVIERAYYALHLANMAWRLKRQRHLSRPVVSVGNLTLGGTGKTPAVIALAVEAVKRGLKPAILTRGYGGRGKGIRFVSRGDGPLMSFREGGDEPVLMAGKLKGVEIIRGADRYEAAKLSHGAELFILDDGFQRVDIYRDVDIVLIDSRGFGNGRLFPLGPLREPSSALSRANIIVETNSTCNPDDSICPIAGPAGALRYRAQHKPVALANHRGEFPVSMIEKKPVSAFCGIGNPEGFRRTLDSLGAKVLNLEAFSDHHVYIPTDLRRILKNAAGIQWIITTEKDIIKLCGFEGTAGLEKVVALRVEFSVSGDFFDKVFEIAGL